ncbi:MAG: response regulator [bacterium]
MAEPFRILWADDEIDLLRPHILYLEERGYDLTPVHSGEDALQLAASESFDLILLDERMPGLDGLEVLERLQAVRPDLPVVMVTKQEDEGLMEEALGRSITDFLTKPVNPSQVLSVCKRILEGRRIRGQAAARDYTGEFARLSDRLGAGELSPGAWGEMAEALAWWAVRLDETGREGLEESLASLAAEADGVLGRRLAADYPAWAADDRPWRERLLAHITEAADAGGDLPVMDSRPLFVHDLAGRVIVPTLAEHGRALLLVLDCLRYDQWLALEPMLAAGVRTERVPVFSQLPTASPFGRNGLFSGRWPDEAAADFGDLWEGGWDEGERGLNRHEPEMLRQVLRAAPASGGVPEGLEVAGFERVRAPGEIEEAARRLGGELPAGLSVLVVGFLDLLAHGQAESEILQELAPDAAAFRALARQWLGRSPLPDLVRGVLSRGVPVLIATDHGSTQVRRGIEVKADETASRGLRWKAGRNLVADERWTVRIDDPGAWRLPRLGVTGTWLLAREDAFLLFRHDAAPLKRKFEASFQHGGISLAELVVPFVRLLPPRGPEIPERQ